MDKVILWKTQLWKGEYTSRRIAIKCLLSRGRFCCSVFYKILIDTALPDYMHGSLVTGIKILSHVIVSSKILS
jgi:hypothetical protein